MPKAEDFASFVDQERERLQRQREELLAKKSELDQQLQAVEREFAAITAYERAKAGKVPFPHQPTTSRRGRRSGRRQEVLGLINASQEGLARAEIINKLDVRGDRREEQSVSNALSALKRAGQVAQEDGRYIPAQVSAKA